MPGLAAYIEAAGMAPVMFHLTGPQPEDLLPAFTLAARGFTPTAQALVLNEYGIEPGSTRERAFARLTASSAYGSLAAQCVKVWMPRLHAANHLWQDPNRRHYNRGKRLFLHPALKFFKHLAGRSAALSGLPPRVAGKGRWSRRSPRPVRED